MNDSTDDGAVNRVIAGRYRVDSQIAKGGMAVVYKATDLTLGRVIALKLLKPVAAADDPGKLSARFKLEAESLAKLNHRNIVTIFDYGETDDGGYFLAMEYVDGPALSSMIRAERLPIDQTMKVVLQVCRALRYAHKAGIVHRDLKPGNILVAMEDEEQRAKLVDFGLAKLTGEAAFTQHGIILGTVHCMAPEQIRGGKIDPRTDIYAMGVVLFRLITGGYPFHSKQPPEVLAAHLHAPVPSFSTVDPELRVPPGLEDVVRKCLQKDPALRYEQVADLITDIAKCMEVPPEQFVSVSLVMRDLPPLDPPANDRSLLLGGLLLGAGALLLVTGAIALAVAVTLVDRAPAPAVETTTTTTSPTPSASPEPAPTPPTAPEPAPTPPTAPEAAPPTAPETAPPTAPERAPVPSAVPSSVARSPARPVPPPAPPPAPAPVSPVPVATDNVVASAPRPGSATSATAAVSLVDVVVATETNQVVVTLKMSSAKVRPLAFEAEGNSGSYRKQYRVQFTGGVNGFGASTVRVGHALVESVDLTVANGVLVVVVNSASTPSMKLEGTGPDFRVVVRP